MKSRKSRKKPNKEQNKKQKNIIYLFFLSIILSSFFIISSYYAINNKQLLWDEPVYLGNAASHIRQSNFTEDFRFPLLEWIISFFWKIFGESVMLAKFIMVIISTLTIFMFYKLSQNYFSKTKSLILTFLFAFSSQFLFWSFRIYTDILALFFIITAFYIFTKSRLSNKDYFFTGIFIGLAFLSRFIVILGAIIFFYLLFTRKHKQTFYYVLGGITSLFPWLIYNIIKYKNPLWDLLEQAKAINSYTHFQTPTLFFKNLFHVFGYSVFIAILFFAFFIYFSFFNTQKPNKININNKNNTLLFIYLLINSLFYMFVIKLKLMRYALMFIPFILIAIFLSINWLLELINIKLNNNHNKIPKYKKIFYILIVILISLSLLLNTQKEIKTLNYITYCSKNSSLNQAITYLSTNLTLKNNTILASNSWPWYGYYLNTKTFSLWNPNLKEFINQTSVDYIILDKNSGLDITHLNHSGTNLTLLTNLSDVCGNQILIYKT